MSFLFLILVHFTALNLFCIAVRLPQDRLDLNHDISTGAFPHRLRQLKSDGQSLPDSRAVSQTLPHMLRPVNTAVRIIKRAADSSLQFIEPMATEMKVPDVGDIYEATAPNINCDLAPNDHDFSADLDTMSSSTIAPPRPRSTQRKSSILEPVAKQRVSEIPERLRYHAGWSQVHADQFRIADLSKEPGIEMLTCRNTVVLLLDNIEGRDSKKLGLASISRNIEDTLTISSLGVQARKNAIQGDAFPFLASKDNHLVAKNLVRVENILRSNGAQAIHHVLYRYHDDMIRRFGIDSKMSVTVGSVDKSVVFRAKDLTNLLKEPEFPRLLPRDPSGPLDRLLKASYERHMRGGSSSDSILAPSRKTRSSQGSHIISSDHSSPHSSSGIDARPELHSNWPNVKSGQMKYVDFRSVGGIEATDFRSQTGIMLLDTDANRAVVANVHPLDMRTMAEFETVVRHHRFKGDDIVGFIYAAKDFGRAAVNNVLEAEKTLHDLGARMVRTIPYVPSDSPGYISFEIDTHQRAKLIAYSEGKIFTLDPWRLRRTSRDLKLHMRLENQTSWHKYVHYLLPPTSPKRQVLSRRTSPKSNRSESFYSIVDGSDRSSVAHAQGLYTHADWVRLTSWDAKYVDFSSSRGIEAVINGGTTGVVLLGKNSAVMASVGPWSLVEMHRLRFLVEMHQVESNDAIMYWTLRHGQSLTPHHELVRIIGLLREIGVKSIVQIGHEVWSESTHIREGYLGVSPKTKVVVRVQDQILAQDAKDVGRLHGVGLPHVLFEKVEHSPNERGHNNVAFQDTSPGKSSTHSKASRGSPRLASRAFSPQRFGVEKGNQALRHGPTTLSDPRPRFVDLRRKAVEVTFSGSLGIVIFGYLNTRAIIIGSAGSSTFDVLNKLESLAHRHEIYTSAIIYVAFFDGRQVIPPETVNCVEQLLRDLGAWPVIFSYDLSIQERGYVGVDTDMRVTILMRSGRQTFDAKNVRRMRRGDLDSSVVFLHSANESEQTGRLSSLSSRSSQLQRGLFRNHHSDTDLRTQQPTWIKVHPGETKYADLKAGETHGIETILGGQTGIIVTNEPSDKVIVACIDPHDLSAAHDLGILVRLHGIHHSAMVWQAHSNGKSIATNLEAIREILLKIEIRRARSFIYDLDHYYKHISISNLHKTTFRDVPIGSQLRTPSSPRPKRVIGFYPPNLYPHAQPPQPPSPPSPDQKTTHPKPVFPRSESSTASNSPLSDPEVNSLPHPPHHLHQPSPLFKPSRPGKLHHIIVSQGDVGFADLRVSSSIECYAFKENTGVVLFDQQRALIASIPPFNGGPVLKKLEDLAREKHLVGQAAIFSSSENMQRENFDWRHLRQVVDALGRAGTSRWRSYVYKKGTKSWNVVVDQRMGISVFGDGNGGWKGRVKREEMLV